MIFGSVVSFLGRIPNRRGVGTFCSGHRNFLRHIHLKILGIECRPAWCWNLNHPRVVKGPLLGIEVGILPNGDKLGGADGIRPAGIGNIHSVTNCR